MSLKENGKMALTPEPEKFLCEVILRTESLAMSVPQVSVFRRCGYLARFIKLKAMCRDMSVFMKSPETVTQALSLSSAAVQRNQLVRWLKYVRAVMHSLLNSWLMKYYAGLRNVQQKQSSVQRMVKNRQGGTWRRK
ncbi:hypothetical protein NPI91_000901 [Salmonella enterica]|nr:hypothetical protein [Salmonella enterica]EJN1667683.1 hypothetical protein [Salmonella enterica]